MHRQTVGPTYVHGGVGCMHEEHQGGGGNGHCPLQAAVAVQVDVDVEGGVQLLACPLPPGLLCEAHLLCKDGHYLSPPLCSRDAVVLARE